MNYGYNDVTEVKFIIKCMYGITANTAAGFTCHDISRYVAFL